MSTSMDEDKDEDSPLYDQAEDATGTPATTMCQNRLEARTQTHGYHRDEVASYVQERAGGNRMLNQFASYAQNRLQERASFINEMVQRGEQFVSGSTASAIGRYNLLALMQAWAAAGGFSDTLFHLPDDVYTAKTLLAQRIKEFLVVKTDCSTGKGGGKVKARTLLTWMKMICDICRVAGASRFARTAEGMMYVISSVPAQGTRQQ